MADFCKQCSIALFGDDYRDLADIIWPSDTKLKNYAAVLCEGCGHTEVDHNGRCVSPHCLHQHGKESK